MSSGGGGRVRGELGRSLSFIFNLPEVVVDAVEGHRRRAVHVRLVVTHEILLQGVEELHRDVTFYMLVFMHCSPLMYLPIYPEVNISILTAILGWTCSQELTKMARDRNAASR